MPLYEYQCMHCKQKTELLRSFFQADEPVNCPHCDQPSMKRMLSKVNAFSDGQSLNHDNHDCSGCSGGSCSSCHH